MARLFPQRATCISELLRYTSVNQYILLASQRWLMFGRHTVGLGMWLRSTALSALVIVGLSGCGVATAPAAARRVEPPAAASPAQEPAPAFQASPPASVAPSAEPAAS